MAENKKKNSAVVNYIIILFLCAFLLMMMTYLMEQRKVAENIDGLRTSVSAMKSVGELYEENTQLNEELNQLEQDAIQRDYDIADQAEEILALEAEVADWHKLSEAMDWFWQINEAFVSGKKTLAMSLIESMEEEGLELYLPLESATDNGRYAAAFRYLEIKKELGMITEES